MHALCPPDQPPTHLPQVLLYYVATLVYYLYVRIRFTLDSAYKG